MRLSSMTGGNMADIQQENRRQTIVINKAFQTRYAAMSALGAIVAINVVLILGYILYLPKFAPVVSTTHTLSLGVTELLVVIVVYYFGIRSSFKIAGPMFALKRGLSQLGEGDLTVRLKFRDNDCCHDVAEQFNIHVSKLDARIRDIREKVGEISNAEHTPEQYQVLTREIWRELCLIKTTK